MVNDKITIRQAYILFFIGIASPLIRLLPIQLARETGGAIWLSPFINFVVFGILIWILSSLFKKNQTESLSQVYDKVLGKPISTIVLIIYIVWIIVLASTSLRNFSERLLSSLYIYAPLQFFMIIMAVVVFFISKASIENLARLVEISLYLFLGIILLITIFSVQNIDLYNFSLLDLEGIKQNITSVPIIVGIFGYFTFVMFLGDKITGKEKIKKLGIKTGILLTAFCLIIIFVTVGSFGAELVEDLTLPFFSAIKNITIFSTIERAESVFITTWILTDFVLVILFVYIICHLIKHISKTNDTKYISTPIIFIIYLLGIFIANNSFELEEFVSIFFVRMNSILSFLIPLIVLIIGKIRKKI